MTAVLETPTTAPARPERPPRIHGLDGLRAVAVSAVLIYHLGIGWLPGGFLGVDLFFVISGFLITTLLLGELGRSGRVNYRQFYLRRARRLLPALFLMLAGTLALTALVARDAALQTLRDVPGALLYVSNWWALGQEQSYFDLIGRGNMLGHLWSLAVEEQFYLLWPLILGAIAVVAKGRVRLGVLIVAGVGAVLSTAWMATLAISADVPLATDPTRVYVGTDTHAMSVLAGAALAAVWHVARFRTDVVPGARRVLAGAGALGLALTALIMLTVTEYAPWLYRGGFLLVAAVFTLVIAAATHPASPLGPALDNPAMRWLGTRSYGVYLYHWPIFLVTRPGQDLPWEGAWVSVLRVGLVLAVAELSYRYLELPIRQGTFGTWWRHRRVLIAGLAAALVLGVLLATAPRAQQVVAAQTFGQTEDIAEVAPAAPTAESTVESIAWYGDSVTLWSVDALRAEFPGVTVDAGLNRAPVNILSRVQPSDGVVVLHLGNAGPVAAEQLHGVLADLADAERVVLINSNADFGWVAQANETIDDVAEGYGNVVVLDWEARTAGQATWFEDGLHLTEAGKAAYATAVREALGE